MTDFAIVLLPLDPEEGGGFVGLVPDLPGCTGDGDTEAEALLDTKNAMQEWLETAQHLGREVPLPGTAAEKLRRRDEAMIDAMRAAVDLMEQKDGQILDLQRKLEVLTRIMQDDSLPRRMAGFVPGAKKALPKAH